MLKARKRILEMPAPAHWVAGAEWLLIAGTLLVLFAPVAGELCGWPAGVEIHENRPLAVFPAIGKVPSHDLSKAIDRWWNDHFAFRAQLVPLFEAIQLDLFGTPGKRYFRGKDGHLFPNFAGNPRNSPKATVLDYLGAVRLTDPEAKDWTDYLEGKSAWLKAFGIHYLFVVAPNKVAVEERFLPEAIRQARGKSFFEQMRERVFPRLTPKVDLLDLTGALIAKENKTGVPMFSRRKGVHHWNNAGFHEGLLAMDEHLRRSFPGMPAFPEDKIELRVSPDDPTVFTLRWKADDSVQFREDKISNLHAGNRRDPHRTTASGRKGNLVLCSDSSWINFPENPFYPGLEGFFPENHTAFSYQWGRYRHTRQVSFAQLRDIVREEHPDVVVEARTERMLRGLRVPPEFRFAAQFSRGRTVFVWSRDNPDAMTREQHIASIVKDDNALVLRATGNDPIMTTSRTFKLPKGSEGVLFADLDMPSNGIFQVFWSLGRGYSEVDSKKARSEIGRNVIFIPLPIPPEKECRLRVDPGTAAGTYRIRKIEVRAVSKNVPGKVPEASPVVNALSQPAKRS